MNGIKSWIFAVITAILGFTAGIFIKTPNAQSENAGGDISKVSKYQKNTISPQLSAFQERMLNNPDELNAQVASLIVLNSRLTDFDNLLSLTDKVTENRSELAEQAQALKNLTAMSENARKSSQEALLSFDQLLDKKNRNSAYDQTATNASLGFLKIERQVSTGKNFVLAADEYLKKNGIDGNEDLAMVRDLWQDFCQIDAIMNADKEESKYWASVDKSLTTLGALEKAEVQMRANPIMEGSLRGFCGTQAINAVIINNGLSETNLNLTPVTLQSVSPMEAMNFSGASFANLNSLPLVNELHDKISMEQLAEFAKQQIANRDLNALGAAATAANQDVIGAKEQVASLSFNDKKLLSNGASDFANIICNNMGATSLNSLVSSMTDALGNAQCILIPSK